MLERTSSALATGRVRWAALGLLAAGCASALLALQVLSASPARGLSPLDRPVLPPAAPADQPAAPPASAARTEVDPPVAAVAVDPELAARVLDATEQLALALEDPAYADALWREEVRTRASTLGRAAIPALRSVLADDSHSVEEHVAANELLATLDAP